MTSTLVNHQMDQIYRGRYGEHDESDEDDTRYYRYYVNKVKKEQGGEEEDLEEKEESTDTEEDIGYNNYPSTSEVEEECYKPDDTNTYDNYEDDDEGEEEEDGEGYVCPTCGTHSQPDERDKFCGEDPHDRSDDPYENYVDARRDDHLPDACDEYHQYYNDCDIDEEDNFCFLYKCGAYYPGHFACNFAAESEAECVSHLREIHSTSKELYKLYKRIA